MFLRYKRSRNFVDIPYPTKEEIEKKTFDQNVGNWTEESDTIYLGYSPRLLASERADKILIDVSYFSHTSFKQLESRKIPIENKATYEQLLQKLRDEKFFSNLWKEEGIQPKDSFQFSVIEAENPSRIFSLILNSQIKVSYVKNKERIFRIEKKQVPLKFK